LLDLKNEVLAFDTVTVEAGEAQTLNFVLRTKSGEPFNSATTTANFAVIDFLNRDSGILITKSVPTSVGDGGLRDLVVINLVYADTANLAGKYIYQLSLRDADGKTVVPGQGIFIVNKNANLAFAAP
jgi:hypothetical protein